MKNVLLQKEGHYANSRSERVSWKKFFAFQYAMMIKRPEVDHFIRYVAEFKRQVVLTIEGTLMCRNIKTLFNFEPPVTEEEIRAASLQFVRKVSGFNKPSKANEAAFLAAVDEIAAVSSNLLRSLETNAPPRNRTEEAAKARARAAQRISK